MPETTGADAEPDWVRSSIFYVFGAVVRCGEGVFGEPGIVRAARGSVGKGDAALAWHLDRDICTYHSTDSSIVNGVVRITHGVCVGGGRSTEWDLWPLGGRLAGRDRVLICGSISTNEGAVAAGRSLSRIRLGAGRGGSLTIEARGIC